MQEIFNRDLSWLEFNYRVLQEAMDRSVPLYNRISFLSIFSSNLDEFFRVRMPAISAISKIEMPQDGVQDDYPKDLLQKAQARIQTQLEDFGRTLTQQILPDLDQNGIHLYYKEEILPQHVLCVREYFLSRVLSFSQPVFLNRKHKKTLFLQNNQLYFAISLSKKDQPQMKEFAVLGIPSLQLPRFHNLPSIGNKEYVIFVDDIIRNNLDVVFPQYQVHGCYAIKITRDAELNLEDEFSGDISQKVEMQLDKRDLGSPTRFLFDGEMPWSMQKFLMNFLGLEKNEMIEGGRYHNLRDLDTLPKLSGSNLTYASRPPVPHPGFSPMQSIFESISEGEKLLHFPYQSYDFILRFFNEAAADPGVTEIYLTVYRVANDSQIVNALMSAAMNGKKVAVFVELKARFDEANNLRWSKKMKAAGIKIVYSIPGLKVHAKVALVKRKKDLMHEYYAILTTGNFNENTARFYTDLALFTRDKNFTRELELLFAYLCSREQPSEYDFIQFSSLLVSQFNMMDRFMGLIDREITNAREGKASKIIIKLNNLQEKNLIRKLYEAGEAGVKIELIVRSICCIRPGVPGLSENISVRRIVDRYLEHARVFIFHNNGNPEFYLGSADWMDRNMHHRIEVCFPVKDRALQNEIEKIIRIQLQDNTKARLLSSQLQNEKIDVPPGSSLHRAQDLIFDFLNSRK